MKINSKLFNISKRNNTSKLKNYASPIIKSGNIMYSEHHFNSCIIRQFPALSDNYIYLISDNISKTVTCVDCGDSNVIINAVNHFNTIGSDNFLHNKKIDYIMCTHHHLDHIGGNNDLQNLYNCPIIGYKNGDHRIDNMEYKYNAGDVFKINGNGIEFIVFDCKGHTLDHCGYYNKLNNILFVGDTLFALGCGRLFEGTFNDMYNTMNNILDVTQYNRDAVIFCAHEYTLNNAKFALSIESDNEMLLDRCEFIKNQRNNNEFTIPSTLGDELDTNPFLRWNSKSIRNNLGLNDTLSNPEIFGKIRAAKDKF